jgi:dephospho-CoA kinase
MVELRCVEAVRSGVAFLPCIPVVCSSVAIRHCMQATLTGQLSDFITNLHHFMLRVGLTGGIGSGKTTVRNLLARKGAGIFDADEEARTLMQEDPTVKAALEGVLGSQAWLPDGTLNKPWIADRIFGDRSVRLAVNEIVHPAVQAIFEERARTAEAQGVRVFVREAALLPPPEDRGRLDRWVVVTAPRAERMQRILERDHTTTERVCERMNSQPTDAAYAAAADDIIRNTGTIAELEDRVDDLWNAWTTQYGLPPGRATHPIETPDA